MESRQDHGGRSDTAPGDGASASHVRRSYEGYADVDIYASSSPRTLEHLIVNPTQVSLIPLPISHIRQARMLSLIAVPTALLLPLITIANPLNLNHLLPRSTPCDLGSRPIVYNEYHVSDCPPKASLDSSGSCPPLSSDFLLCQSYCEIRTTFTYTQEIPLSKSGYCHGPLTCSVTDTDTKTFTYTGSGNVGGTLAKVLNIGVTGGYSQAQTKTSTETKSIALKQNECGYITFIPIVRTSW